MIFYNSQLMPDTGSALLFMVSNPIPFTNAEDHNAGIFLQLHELIEQSIGAGENPIALIEHYLETAYIDGREVHEIANFLMHHDAMVSALWKLEEQWQNVDFSIAEESIRYGGMSSPEVTALYSSITLRSYLETLSTFNR